MKERLLTTAMALAIGFTTQAQAADPIKIGLVHGSTGPFEAYAAQLKDGLLMGFEYATGGTMKVLGRDIQLVEKDTQLKPDRARALLAEAFGDDDVDLAVGPVSSGVALAVLPIAEEYEKIVIPQGVANSITGANWNRYVFRIGRNSSQDAISNAVAVGKPGTCVSSIAQDYAYGRDGVSAYKAALESAGAKLVHEEYVPTDTKDFTASAERLFDSLKDRKDCKEKFIFAIWAGKGNPIGKINDMQPERFGIGLTMGGNILPAMVGYKQFPGMVGATTYYYENPNNPVNDWLIAEHQKRHNSPPDLFTAQGMAQGMAIISAIKKAGSTDTAALITAFEGLEFESPKGNMKIRAKDHQALQSMYQFKIRVDPAVKWAIPDLTHEIKASQMNIPIQN